jgi:tetratricopeptide (TPR) repeat protein
LSVLETLESLVGKSLVKQTEAHGQPRLAMLETIREYARDRLIAAGEAERVRERHRACFLALAEEAEPKLVDTEQAEWLRRLEEEHDNLRSALDWSLMAAGSQEDLRLCGALNRFWSTRGHLSEGRKWCARILAKERAAERTPEYAKVLNAAGNLAWNQTDYPAARALLEESLAIFRELDDRAGIAQSLNNLGNAAIEQGDYLAARTLYEESLAIRLELGDRRGVATVLCNLGNVAYERGDFTAARVLSEALAISRELGDRGRIADALNNLGNLACNQGDFGSARSLIEESLAIGRDLVDLDGIASSLHSLGVVAYLQGDLAAAKALYTESLDNRRELGDRLGLARALEGLATVADALGSSLRAAHIWGAAERLREEIGTPLSPTERPRYDQRVAAARVAVGDDAAFDRAWQEGRALTLEQSIALALEETVERA